MVGLKHFNRTLIVFTFILAGIAVCLIIAGFLVPPMGVIDGSVLIATGELFGWASLFTVIKAIDKGISAHLKKGDTEIDLTKCPNTTNDTTI